MKKSKKIELTQEQKERVITMAIEEKKPFEAIKEEFGVLEAYVIEIMKKHLSKENFELWKKKVTSSKPKLKQIKQNNIEDDDLDSKYYFKNKFD